MQYRIRTIVFVFLCASLISCNRSIRPDAPSRVDRIAFLVLPGFGYDGNGESSISTTSEKFKSHNIDLFVADYVKRSGLEDTRKAFLKFYADNKLQEYKTLYVFAFIAGAWTLNPYLSTEKIPNLKGIIYDRSPLQERAPRIASEELGFFTWVYLGSPPSEMAKLEYTPMTTPGIRVGLMVETIPTYLVKKYAKTALSYGPISFEPESFSQKHDDLIYVAKSHDQMYDQFPELVDEIIQFIDKGKFSSGANRKPPEKIPLSAD